MANSKSAEKRIRQNLKHRERNRFHRAKMRTAIKKLRQQIEAGDADSAQSLLPGTLRVIDASVSKGIVHQNAAARYKSRLTKAVSALAS